MPADPAALARAIGALGLTVDVEADGALAILVARPGTRFPDAALRAEVVRAAREAGFTSVAFELAGPDAGAGGA